MVRNTKKCKLKKRPASRAERAPSNAGEETLVAGQRFVLGREAFAKISEVENIRLTDDMKQAFAKFDRQRLLPDERRRRITRRFTPPR
jgi:hypothetical protein